MVSGTLATAVRRWRQNVSVNANRAAMVAVMTDATLAQPLVEKIKVTSADSASLQKRFEAIETTAKGKQLHENPRACLVFHWAPLERMVRRIAIQLPSGAAKSASAG